MISCVVNEIPVFWCLIDCLECQFSFFGLVMVLWKLRLVLAGLVLQFFRISILFLIALVQIMYGPQLCIRSFDGRGCAVRLAL